MHTYQVLQQGLSLEKATKALILIHGRGGSASDLLNIAYACTDHQFYLVAPQATHHTWYPQSFMAPEQLNEPWLSSAVQTIKRLIEETSVYIPKERIYVMGFSQGACLALETTTRFATRYGGIIAFTGGLIGQMIDERHYQGDFEGTPVFIGISDQDLHVPLNRVLQSQSLMEKLGASVNVKVYPGMGHTINQDEINQAKMILLS